jgi:hypothetical protein
MDGSPALQTSAWKAFQIRLIGKRPLEPFIHGFYCDRRNKFAIRVLCRRKDLRKDLKRTEGDVGDRSSRIARHWCLCRVNQG